MKSNYEDLEKAVVAVCNLIGWDLKWVGDKNYCYDAYGFTIKGNSCVMEMKFRTTYYETKMIEKKKYDAIMNLPECVKLYFVNDPKGSYVYHLNDLVLPELEVKQLPETTYWNAQKVRKEVYYLEESQAVVFDETPIDLHQKFKEFSAKKKGA